MKSSIPLLSIVILFDFTKVANSNLTGWRLFQMCLATSRSDRKRASSTPREGRGFAASSPSPAPTDSFEETVTKKKRIYSMPALYDLAFGYRAYDQEAAFLVNQHKSLHQGKAPNRVLELAAGPARHCVCALQASLVSGATALDNSHEMVEYGKQIAKEELDLTTQESFNYINADMTNFDVGDNMFESAWVLLGSLQHLLTNSEVVSCFESIHKALKPTGTLILELPHPRETFSLVECTRNGWKVPLEDEDGEQSGELQIVWGDDDDDFDPIKQVRQFTVAMELDGFDNGDPSLQNVREVVPMRLFTSQEIDALATISGFEVVALHGALEDHVGVNDGDEAYRLVCVLQKK